MLILSENCHFDELSVYQDAYDDDHIGLEYELADYDGYEAEGEHPDTEDRERGEDRAHEMRVSEEEGES